MLHISWSEYKDSNFGPPGPKPGALPDCATLRMKLVETAGVEPSSARGGGFTVHWGYQFSYISNLE